MDEIGRKKKKYRILSSKAPEHPGRCRPDSCPYFDGQNVDRVINEHIQLMHAENRYYQLWKEAEEKVRKLEERLWEEKQKRQKLEVQLAKYHEKIFKPNRKNDEEGPDSDTICETPSAGKTGKRPGAKPGHPGSTRAKPDHIDEEIQVSLDRCPHCGETDLSALKKVREHIQEDIVLVRPRATRYVKQLYYCPGCKKEVSGRGEGEIPNAYIGPTARAVAATLRYEMRVPYRQVKSIFAEMFGLRLTPGALVGFDHKFASRGRPWYEFLKNHVKSSPHIHADETGWRVDGINHYLWIFNNSRLTLFRIDRSRGSHIPKDILGENYSGALITDCYSGYNPVNARFKQKCIAHFLRDAHSLEQIYPNDEQVLIFADTLKEYMKHALDLQKMFRRKDITRNQLNKALAFMKEKFWAFMECPLENHDADTLRKRLITHRKAIFTFLIHTSIDATNNRAERGLRPSVIMRKVTFGNRAHTGSRNHETLMSLIHTAKQNGTSPLRLLSNLASGCSDSHFRNLLIDSDPAPT